MPRLTDEQLDKIFQDPAELDRVLTRAKVRKDTGLGDQAEIDAIRSKMELEKALGTLFSREHVLEALVQEHTDWGKAVDQFPAMLLNEVAGSNFPISIRETLKSAAEKCVRDIRTRMARGRTAIAQRAGQQQEQESLEESIMAELDSLAAKTVEPKRAAKSLRKGRAKK